MTFVTPDFPTTVAFTLIVFFVVACFVAGVYSAEKSLGQAPGQRALMAAIGVTAWVLFFAALVSRGEVSSRTLPLFFALANGGALVFALSPLGLRLAQGLSIPVLVAFQGFRFPLELVLHSWVEQGSIPQTMTWSGQNWDILSGIIALIAAQFARRSIISAWVANVLGIVLLLNVGRVALFSSPVPFGWGVHPPLQLGFHLPYALIVPVCVAGALAGHVILTRALLMEKK